jgi:hypothetical protein
VAPDPEFARNMAVRGIWKRKTITTCFRARKIFLKTTEPAPATCVCDIIRVGDEFFVAHGVGDHRRVMREYEEIWAQAAKHAQAVPQAE